MLFSRLIVAAAALSIAAAVPVPCETEDHNASKTVDAKSSSHALVAKPTGKAKAPPAPPKKATPPPPPKKASPPAPPKKASPPPPPKKASPPAPPKKASPPPPPPAKSNNNKGKSTSSSSEAASKTTTSAAASKTTPPPNVAANLPPPKNTATDSGVTGVILGCENPDGVTGCFEILNQLGSCFSIPRPLANNVGFFLPPPPVAGVPNTCTLFPDEDCKQGKGVAGAGQISVAGQNSFICNATASATTTDATTTTTTSAAANTAIGLPPPKNANKDSGVNGVIEGCVNPDGVTECFQILNILGSCFSIPRPLANNVGFFLPPPPLSDGTPAQCTLFSDEDCKDGATPVAGQNANVKQNSFICNNATAPAH